MKLVGRHDWVLVGALGFAFIVVFAGPIRYLLSVARDVERSSGLTLVPALVIPMRCGLPSRGKHAHAAAEAAEAIQSESRVTEMERLVLFGHGLGRSLDVDAIRDVVQQHLPKLAETDEAWVMTRSDGHWQALFGSSREARREFERAHERVADGTLAGDTGQWPTDPVSAEGHLCVPMTAGGVSVGVLGVPDSAGPFGDGRRRVLAAAATLLGTSLRNAQLVRELKDNSVRDVLTGCFNRPHAMEIIDFELRRARRSQMSVSLIPFDLDRFAEVNDRRHCGDAGWRWSARMRDVLRGSDFAPLRRRRVFVPPPETPLEGAKRVADTLRHDLADCN
jgi:hypothetical protein